MCVDLYIYIQTPKLKRFPTQVTTLEGFAFSYCSVLKHVEIPDLVTTIHDATFSVCVGLESVKIPDSVTSLGYHAFSYCAKLKLGSSSVLLCELSLVVTGCLYRYLSQAS